MDYTSKELIKTFSYSTMKEDRHDMREIVVNGRRYMKFGITQAVTFVGNLYRVFDPSVKLYKEVLLVGISKQNPCDQKLSRDIAYESANLRAQTAPDMVISVDGEFSRYNFMGIVNAYIPMMRLQFVKTADEIRATDKCRNGIEKHCECCHE